MSNPLSKLDSLKSLSNHLILRQAEQLKTSITAQTPDNTHKKQMNTAEYLESEIYPDFTYRLLRQELQAAQGETRPTLFQPTPHLSTPNCKTINFRDLTCQLPHHDVSQPQTPPPPKKRKYKHKKSKRFYSWRRTRARLTVDSELQQGGSLFVHHYECSFEMEQSTTCDSFANDSEMMRDSSDAEIEESQDTKDYSPSNNINLPTKRSSTVHSPTPKRLRFEVTMTCDDDDDQRFCAGVSTSSGSSRGRGGPSFLEVVIQQGNSSFVDTTTFYSSSATATTPAVAMATAKEEPSFSDDDQPLLEEATCSMQDTPEDVDDSNNEMWKRSCLVYGMNHSMPYSLSEFDRLEYK